MSFFEFDCSDRTFEEIQIFAGFQDSNLDMLSKCFKSVCMIRDQKIKVEVNETLSAHKVEEVIEACFSIIDTQHRLNSQDVSYICSLAFKNRLKDFKAHQLQAVCKTKTGKMIYPKTIGQAILCDAMRHNEIVFATGVAGTGKTYLAVAYAVSMLKSERVEKIILTRPAVEAGESLGFLPGDMKEKVDPYLRPLYDALNEMLGLETVEKYVEKQVIEIAPLAFMRGRTLNDAIGISVADTALAIDIKCIIAFTQSGNTVRRLAKFRPCAPILAVTFDEVTQRSLLPVNGVTPVVSNIQNNKENDIDLARNLALQAGFKTGDHIIVVAGYPIGSGNTNMMRIAQI